MCACVCVRARTHVYDPVGRDDRESSVIPVLGCSSTPHLLPPLTLHKRRLGPTLSPPVSEGPLLFPAPGPQNRFLPPPHSLCLGPGETTGLWLCWGLGLGVDHGPKELSLGVGRASGTLSHLLLDAGGVAINPSPLASTSPPFGLK